MVRVKRVVRVERVEPMVRVERVEPMVRVERVERVERHRVPVPGRECVAFMSVNTT
ncbi:hypothetical protein [Streptomyces sp. AM 3-1-1]|uniref:hypothetical protein n=1 Tax=Streptomyces sp. AM 3-1-1 TaxID=3028711 RepID=UPI0023B8BA1F|nr:hypothetical protein [Streptomyces sp. AM 3-1-1]WEH28242.1 hypothetical protein P0D76_13355 [Streptomyces sp. AM 3-1-1]